MHGNYDSVAPYYDLLARLVFGSSIQKAQIFLLPAIPQKARVLIVGGGTGWILREISKLHPGGLAITYVELSGKMMARAKSRATENNKLYFVNKAIQETALNGDYDIIITPFLLDNFSADTLRKVFQKLDHHLKHKGMWLFADFKGSGNSKGQKIVLKMMYLFFNLMCKLETSTLHDPSLLFQEYGYRPLRQKSFHKGFICSVVYQKKELIKP